MRDNPRQREPSVTSVAITRNHWAVNIRKFVLAADELDDLVRLGTLSETAAASLTAAVESGLNILVAGGTQAAPKQGD